MINAFKNLPDYQYKSTIMTKHIVEIRLSVIWEDIILNDSIIIWRRELQIDVLVFSVLLAGQDLHIWLGLTALKVSSSQALYITLSGGHSVSLLTELSAGVLYLET